jgi:hypothetical protein
MEEPIIGWSIVVIRDRDEVQVRHAYWTIGGKSMQEFGVMLVG